MKVLDAGDIWKYDTAVSGISVIRQTPAWNNLVCRSRMMNGFLLIDEGELIYRWKNETETISHGSLIYLPAGSVHCCDRNAYVSYYRINFIMTDCADREQIVFSECPVIVDRNLGNHMFQLCAEMADSCLSNKNFLTLSLFGEFMDQLMQTHRGESGILHAVDRISAHYTEETDLKKLAEECYMSRAQFFRLFRQAAGVSPLEYRNRLRIEKAKKLISEGGCSMSEIAGILGFGSVYYFSRVFKAVAGISPTQYAAGASVRDPE